MATSKYAPLLQSQNSDIIRFYPDRAGDWPTGGGRGGGE